MGKIKFNISKQEDIDTARGFYNYKLGGIDFGETIIYTLPNLKNKKQIQKEINLFYKKNLDKLKKKTKEFSKKWSKIEKQYLKLVKNLFNQSWPRGKYICYISIFSCNPRNLKDKTFQIYYKENKILLLNIAHELLHFMFYDYFDKNFKRKLNENKLWILSEVFNDIILNQKQFQKLIKCKETPYPHHKIIYKKLNKEYKNSKSLKEFIEKSIKIIK